MERDYNFKKLENAGPTFSNFDLISLKLSKMVFSVEVN